MEAGMPECVEEAKCLQVVEAEEGGWRNDRAESPVEEFDVLIDGGGWWCLGGGESDEEAARLEYLALASDEELQDLKSTLKRASLLLRPTLIRQQQRLAKEENAGGPPSPTLAADPAILELLSFVSEKQKARWAALGEDATGLDEYDLDLIKLVTSLQRPSTFITDPTSPTLTAANATQGLTESSSIPFNETVRSGAIEAAIE
ncbi:hypothetical protein DFJ73DRAFT_777070 [Zopfochytrium polystomum]|nr:hypothetical protein DFJ73DRAFT_777070 [Zopfochytrium polystomum]